MEIMVRNYRERATEAGRETDEELLMPILKALSLEASSEPEA